MVPVEKRSPALDLWISTGPLALEEEQPALKNAMEGTASVVRILRARWQQGGDRKRSGGEKRRETSDPEGGWKRWLPYPMLSSLSQSPTCAQFSIHQFYAHSMQSREDQLDQQRQGVRKVSRVRKTLAGASLSTEYSGGHA